MLRSLAVSVLFAAACTSASPTGITAQEVACPTDSTLTYASFGESFVRDNCLSCHAGKDSPNLSTQIAIKQNTTRMLDQAVYTDAMPQDSNMALAERQMLGEWLSCGAP
jgi:uncharacterized membrane protein